jgi:hypothetical protein
LPDKATPELELLPDELLVEPLDELPEVLELPDELLVEVDPDELELDDPPEPPDPPPPQPWPNASTSTARAISFPLVFMASLRIDVNMVVAED